MNTLRMVFSALSRRERIRYLLFSLARIGSHGLDLVGLALLAWVASTLASNESLAVSAGPISWSVDLAIERNLVLVFGGLAAVFTLKSLLGAWLLRRSTLFLARLDSRQARRVASFLFGGPVTRFSDLAGGELNWSIMRSSQSAFGTLLFSVGTIVSELSLFVLVTAFLFYINPVTTIALLLYFSLVTAFFLGLVSQRTRRLGARYQENSQQTHEILEGLTKTFREATVAGKTSPLIRWLFIFRDQQARDWAGHRFLLAVPRYLVEAALVIGVFLLATVQTVLGNLSSPAELAVLLLAGLRLLASLLPIQTAFTDIRINIPQARRALEILHSISDAPQTEETSEFDERSGVEIQSSRFGGRVSGACEVSVTGLTYAYKGNRHKTLQSVSLHVDAGGTHVIVGPSGAGKSTLVDCLLGLLEPEAGSVHIDGITGRNFVRQLPGAVGFVPQRPGFIPGTILQNISLDFDVSKSVEAEAVRALRVARLHEFVSSLPQGLHTPIGSQLDGLSGGQFQRLAIARAVFHHPGLLVLDEPTSFLDRQNERAIHSALEELGESTTIIVVAHRLTTMKMAKTVHFLDRGRLVASGSYRRLLEQERRFKDFVHLLPG